MVSAGRAFQMRRTATGQARLPTVESLTEGSTRRLVPAITLTVLLDYLTIRRSDYWPYRYRTIRIVYTKLTDYQTNGLTNYWIGLTG